MDYSTLRESLKTVDARSLVDKVEANLVDLLTRRTLRIGDSIPKEVELAESLVLAEL